LCGSLIAELLGSASAYQTYINFLYRFVVLGAAIALLPLTRGFVRSLARSILLPAIYVATFMLVSYYGVNFAFSVKYRVLLMPVLLVDFAIWFAAGYYVTEKQFLKYFAMTACLFGLGSLAFAASGLIDPEQTRVIYGVDLPLAMPVAVMSGGVFIGGVILFLSLLSLKKTVVACTLIGFASAYALKKFGGLDTWSNKSRVSSAFHAILRSPALGVLLLAVACGLLAYRFLPYLAATYERFSVEGEDITRLAALAEFLRLVKEYFPVGTGYYTFAYLTADTLPYYTFTAAGDEIGDGMPLHNTYMHFVLEGGLPILIVVGFMYARFALIVRRLYSARASRPLGIVMISWIVICIVFAMLQQFHATRYFFGILGYGFGAYARYRIAATRPAAVSNALCAGT